LVVGIGPFMVVGVPLVGGASLDVDEGWGAFKVEGEDACLVVMELEDEVEGMGNST
jgi:hypothetical protein